MAVVQVAASAAANIRELTTTRELPPAAIGRVRLRLRQLERFPLSGELITEGAFEGTRVLTGPWWFLFIYVYDEDADLVTVTAALDARAADGSAARGDAS